MKALIIIERGQDGTYSAYPAKLNTTIIGEGETAEAAKADFLNSYEEIKQYYLEVGEDMPAELKDLVLSTGMTLPLSLTVSTSSMSPNSQRLSAWSRAL